MWGTLILLYFAGIGASYLSLKTLLKQKRTIDTDEFHVMVVIMFVPFINFIASLIAFAIATAGYTQEYMKKRSAERKKNNRKSFIEVLFGMKKTEGYFMNKYIYEEKKKKRELE